MSVNFSPSKGNIHSSTSRFLPRGRRTLGTNPIVTEPDLLLTHHFITATSVLNAQFDITLVIDGGRVRELVRLEVDQSGSLGSTILKFAHNLVLHRTPK